MSLTLGEKLRQAREARGISSSEVAEQTRISPLYIKSIEENDYRPLPGGIFNKGFVKSYAKYVGFDEQEALSEYAALLSRQNVSTEEEVKTFRPQVLTDDNASSTGWKTVAVAAVILGLMIAGILALMNYLQHNPSNVALVNMNTAVNNNSSNAATAASPTPNVSTAAPTMNDLKVELKTTGEPVSVTATVDGKKSYPLMSSDKPLEFEPKQSLTVAYSKTLAANVSMSVNGKQIALPSAPAIANRKTIEVAVTKDNLASIWQSGKVGFDAPPAPQ